MKFLLRQLAALAFFLIPWASQAANVAIAANNLGGGTVLIKTAAGLAIPSGMIVRIGTFAAGPPIITSSSTFAEINALFTPIGEDAGTADDGTNGPLVTNASSGYAGTINNVNNSVSQFAATTRLYIMILDVPQASMSSATSWLIMSDATNWVIPASGTKALTASQISAGEILAGQFVSATEFRLVAIVPEPGSMAMCLAAAGLFLRRRR